MQDLISDYLIKDEILSKIKLEKRPGKSNLGNATRLALYCMEIVNTNTNKRNQIKRFFNMRHYMQKSIFLLEFILQHNQYIRKLRTSFYHQIK